VLKSLSSIFCIFGRQFSDKKIFRRFCESPKFRQLRYPLVANSQSLWCADAGCCRRTRLLQSWQYSTKQHTKLLRGAYSQQRKHHAIKGFVRVRRTPLFVHSHRELCRVYMGHSSPRRSSRLCATLHTVRLYAQQSKKLSTDFDTKKLEKFGVNQKKWRWFPWRSGFLWFLY